jgi:ATP-binding cassette subfamily G (WHITE) protein 2 (SNQ2)
MARSESHSSSTRGLDSSTALEYVKALRIATDLVHTTAIVSIYQAGESLYNIFDKVCLIYEGRMVYFGSTDDARAYFQEMGYVPVERQTTPDFLVAVTDPNGRQARGDLDRRNDGEGGGGEGGEGGEGVGGAPIPKTAMEFEQYYRNSGVWRENMRDMDEYRALYTDKREVAERYKDSARQEKARHTRRKVHPPPPIVFLHTSSLLN